MLFNHSEQLSYGHPGPANSGSLLLPPLPTPGLSETAHLCSHLGSESFERERLQLRSYWDSESSPLLGTSPCLSVPSLSFCFCFWSPMFLSQTCSPTKHTHTHTHVDPSWPSSWECGPRVPLLTCQFHGHEHPFSLHHWSSHSNL